MSTCKLGIIASISFTLSSLNFGPSMQIPPAVKIPHLRAMFSAVTIYLQGQIKKQKKKRKKKEGGKASEKNEDSDE